jgi:hypothetical protein
MKNNIKFIVSIIVVLLGVSSGWVYNEMKKSPNSFSTEEINSLQVSFIRQYGTDANITEGIIPKIYEVAWTDKDGNKNVSMNVGGVWVLINSVPKGE